MQEQELFKTYEVKNWDLSARIYKILAASVAVNILALLIFGQTNLLTQKGCDSPLVEKVCQVLDTVYVGSSILTTNKDYIDDPNYEKTELTDADITWIDQTGVEKFKYPDGYRALANPELMQPQEIPNADGSFPANIPGIPNSTIGGGGNLMNEPQVLPPANSKAVTNLPDSPFSFGGANPTVKQPKFRQPKPYKFPKSNNIDPTRNNQTLSDSSPNKLDLSDKTAKKENKPKQTNPTTENNPTIDKNEPVAGIVINKEPLNNLKVYVNDLQSKNQLNLSSPFSVQAKGKLNKDGKIDSKNFKFTQAKSSDENMVAVVKKSIESINDSGYLQYLSNLSGKDLEFNFNQDGKSLSAVIQSELESDTRANTVSGLLKLAISLSKSKKEKAIASMQADNKPEEAQNLQNEIDDLEILKNAKITPDGKKVIIEFVVPQDIAAKMIQRKLNEPEKPEVKKQSTAQITDGNKNTVK